MFYGCLAERLLQRAADGKTSEAVLVFAEDLEAKLQDFGGLEGVAGGTEKDVTDMKDAECLERRLVTTCVELVIASEDRVAFPGIGSGYGSEVRSCCGWECFNVYEWAEEE